MADASDDRGRTDRPEPWPEETVPILRVTDAAASVAWYRRLGFEEEWTHRFTPALPAFVCIRRGTPGDGVRLFLSEHEGDAAPHGAVYLRVADVAPIAAEFGLEITDSGARLEVALHDPDLNTIRAGSLTGRTDPRSRAPRPPD